MSSYEFAGGSLKLKGVSDNAISKKKKKKSKNKEIKIAANPSVSKPSVSDHDSSNEEKQNPLLTYFQKSSDAAPSSVGPQEVRKLPKHHREVLEFKERQRLADEANAATAAAAASLVKKAPTKTKAELAYERRMQERLEEKILARAEKSHKEHVETYNSHLDSLSEYNDIPKVSWTK